MLQHFTEASDRAQDLAGELELHGNLSEAHSAVGRLAYNEASEARDQKPAARN